MDVSIALPFDELAPFRAANRALIGSLADFDVAANRAEEEIDRLQILSGLHRFDRHLVELRVDGFCANCIRKHSVRLVRILCRLFHHGRVHRRILIRFSLDGGFKVLER
jgi:hypothetical protein